MISALFWAAVIAMPGRIERNGEASGRMLCITPWWVVLSERVARNFPAWWAEVRKPKAVTESPPQTEAKAIAAKVTQLQPAEETTPQ